MFVFRKIWRALFSSNTHFEIRPFALLPTKCKASKRFQNLKLENNMPPFLPPRANEKDTKKIFPIFHSQEFSFFFFWTLHWNYNKRTYCNGSANWNHARYLFKNHFLLFINTILKSDYFLVYITSTEKWTNSILISFKNFSNILLYFRNSNKTFSSFRNFRNFKVSGRPEKLYICDSFATE